MKLISIAGAIFARQIREGILKESALYSGGEGTWSTMPKDQPVSKNDTMKTGNDTNLETALMGLPIRGAVKVPYNMTRQYRAGERLRNAMERALKRAKEIVEQVQGEAQQLKEEVKEVETTTVHLYHVVATLGLHMIHLIHFN